MKIAVIGAGLSGATIARELADYGVYDVTVYDARDHVAGNVHSYERNGVMVHAYGPHIFHTDNDGVWGYFGRFTQLEPYIQRTKGFSRGQVFSLPINLHTMNQFFGEQMSPTEMRGHVSRLAKRDLRSDKNPEENFETYAISLVGRDLYNAFLRDYTLKQWGLHPTLLPAAILKRLPLRFDYSDNAFFHRFQGIPRDGYTAAVERMLDHKRIEVRLCDKIVGRPARADHVFYSGEIDKWFGYRFGKLPYRTLDLKHEIGMGDAQGCAVINACDLSVPWTRSTEHHHFTPWVKRDASSPSIITREYPRDAHDGDIPYYPVRLAAGSAMLDKYLELAKGEQGVTFVGRLGTYQYLDMDKTIEQAIRAAEVFHHSRS